ncbi:hypothetical protein NECAME_06635 [Necator americanus]|uniref:Uncharacterized protein n=1 Tax=Necator americanus TaxID=51031 RepID=W2TS77_NECAM|nr:hypothetical protein NECAME_06635 [Necator americanus]ETN84910.1 hypothetical protein NECAME_06635 [Necator americanus]
MDLVLFRESRLDFGDNFHVPVRCRRHTTDDVVNAIVRTQWQHRRLVHSKESKEKKEKRKKK